MSKLEVTEKSWKPDRLLLLRFGISKKFEDKTQTEVKKVKVPLEKVSTGDTYFEKVAK